MYGLRKALTVVASIMLITACSTGGDEGGSDSSDDPKAAEAAEARVAGLYEDVTTIAVTEPLPSAPPAGQKVFFLVGNGLNQGAYELGFEESAAALDWDLTIRTYESSDPQAANAAMTQAVADGADSIVIGAQSVDFLSQGMEAAKAADVPVVFINGLDDATGRDGNWVFANIAGGKYVEEGGKAEIDAAIADSGGNANILWVTLPDAQVLKQTTPALEEHVKTACPQCSWSLMNLSSAQLGGGEVGSLIVAELQKDPDIDYVLSASDQFIQGVPQALDQVGLADQVKLAGFNPLAASNPLIADGSIWLAVQGPFGESAWACMDALARESLGVEIDPSVYDPFVYNFVNEDNPPTGDGIYQGPDGYQDQYKELWQVG